MMKNLKNRDNGSLRTLLKVLHFIGRYRVLLFLSVVLAGASVVLQLYAPVLFGDAIDGIIAQGRVDFGVTGAYLAKAGIVIALAAAATFAMNLINNRMTYAIVQDIRSKAIHHIQHLPLSYLDGHSTGDIVSRIIADADTLSDGLLLGFSQLFSGVVTIVVTLIFMLTRSVAITLLVTVMTPLSFIVARFIATHSYTMFRAQSAARGTQTALIEEMIGNQKVVKAFGYEATASARFADINKELQQASQQAIFYSSLTNPSTRFVNSLTYAAVALAGAFRILSGKLTVGGLSVLLSYANQYMKPFNDISSVVTELQNALACAERIFALIEEPGERADADGVLSDVSGDVEIKDVAFSYDKSKKLIEHFSLKAAKGTRVAIVGPTGCGKTTFINLLMRFYDTDAGEISVDGKEIRSVSRASLRAATAWCCRRRG